MQNEKAEKIDIIYMRRFTDKFPSLFEDDKVHILQDAIDSIYEMFLGIDDVFCDNDKVRRCYGLLVAWYIADLYPNECIGVISTGGGLIKSKAIGGVKISFDNHSIFNNSYHRDLLEGLDSNVFGKKAKMMIKASANRIASFRQEV